MESMGLEFTFPQWFSLSGLHFCSQYSCTWLWACFCWNSPWSSKCHSHAGITLPAVGMCQPSRLLVYLLFSWDPSVRQKVNTQWGPGRREGDAQEGEDDAMRGHISVGFSVHFVLPQFTSCAGEKGWCTEMSDCARAELFSYIAQYNAVSGKKAGIIHSLA